MNQNFGSPAAVPIPGMAGGLPQKNIESRATRYGTGAQQQHPGLCLPYSYYNIPTGNTRNLINQFNNNSIPTNFGFRNENLQPVQVAQRQLHQGQQQPQPMYQYQPQPVCQQLPQGSVRRNDINPDSKFSSAKELINHYESEFSKHSSSNNFGVK